MSTLKAQLAAKKAVDREKPQNAEEAMRLAQFTSAHPELLRACDKIPADDLRAGWMLRQMRLREAFDRQRLAIGKALEEFPALKQKLVARKTLGPRQKPGDTGPKISF